MMVSEMDNKILESLRADSRESYRRIARKLKVHPATVIRRVREMEKAGIIAGFGVKLDYQKMGYEYMGLVEIYAESGHIGEVERHLSTHAGVVELWDVTGDVDMITLIACRSRPEFNKVIKSLSRQPHVERTVTNVVLDVIKKEWEFTPQ